MDILELYLDTKEANDSVTAKASEKPLKSTDDQFTADLDVLMDEFNDAKDNASRKEALLAMLKLTGRKI